MLSTIFHIAFFIVIGVFSIVSLLAVYIYIRYGRTLSITLASSAAFAILMLIGFASAFVSLQNLLELYV